jgi:hypothetical protein
VTAVNAILSGTGSAFADGLRINRTTSNSTQYTLINHTGGATNIVSVDQSGNNIAEIYFGRSINGSTISNSMMINKDGNVGIGTNDPASLLSIQRGASGDNMELIGSGESGYSDILFYNTSKAARLGYIDWSNTQARWNVEANIPLVLYTNATERMRIAANGEVTFGVTAAYDTSLLWRTDFVGGIHGRIFATGAPRVVVVAGESNGVQLTSGATSWSSNSDERLKNINSEIENAVEKLLTLRTVKFSWKSDESNKENLGLIAQDVEKEFPQVIDKGELAIPEEEQTDKTEYLSIRYTELIPVLVKAIQELKSENDNLKSRLEVLEQS